MEMSKELESTLFVLFIVIGCPIIAIGFSMLYDLYKKED